MVGEAFQQGSGEAFRAEYLGPFVERQVGGDQDGSPFVALAKTSKRSSAPVGDRGTGSKSTSSS